MWEEQLLPDALFSTNFEASFRACRWDTKRFAIEMLGVDGHPGQTELWEALLARDPTHFRPAYLTLCLSAGNRAGKTLGLAIAILHRRSTRWASSQPDARHRSRRQRWMPCALRLVPLRRPHEVAELVFFEMVQAPVGHPRGPEGTGCPLTEHLGKEVVRLDQKYRGEYR